jgi:hypothetical protein
MMVIKTIRKNRKLALFKDEGYDEPYVLEFSGGRVIDTYRDKRKALRAYVKISNMNSVKVKKVL